CSYRHFTVHGSDESPFPYTTTSWPRRYSSQARFPTKSSVPPYWRGGTSINGGLISAIRIAPRPRTTPIFGRRRSIDRKLRTKRTHLDRFVTQFDARFSGSSRHTPSASVEVPRRSGQENTESPGRIRGLTPTHRPLSPTPTT